MNRGISFPVARERVIQAIEDSLQYQRNNGRSSLIGNNDLQLLFYLLFPNSTCIILLAVALATNSTKNQIDFRPGLIVTICWLFVVLVSNVWVIYRYRITERDEINNEVEKIMKEYKQAISVTSMEAEDDPTFATIHTGHPHISIVTTYRKGMWQRIPSLLLAEGDIIALMTGDITPTKVIELKSLEQNPSVNDVNNDLYARQGRPPVGEIIETGVKIHLREGRHHSVMRTASGNNPNNLSLRTFAARSSSGHTSIPDFAAVSTVEPNELPNSDAHRLGGETSPRSTESFKITQKAPTSSIQQLDQPGKAQHGGNTPYPPQLPDQPAKTIPPAQPTTPHHSHNHGGNSHGQGGGGSGWSRHRAVPSDSTDLLVLSGDVRCFYVVETPMRNFCEGILTGHFKDEEGEISGDQLKLSKPFRLFPLLPNRTNQLRASGHKGNESVLRLLFQSMVREGCLVMCLFLILSVAGSLLRIGLVHRARDDWGEAVLAPLCTILMCFAPVSLPLGLLAAETLATADLLATTEALLFTGADVDDLSSMGDEGSQRSRGSIGRDYNPPSLQSQQRHHRPSINRGSNGNDRAPSVFNTSVPSSLEGLRKGTVSSVVSVHNQVRSALGLSSNVSRSNNPSERKESSASDDFSASDGEFHEADIEDRAERIAEHASRSVPWGSRFKYAARILLVRLGLADSRPRYPLAIGSGGAEESDRQALRRGNSRRPFVGEGESRSDLNGEGGEGEGSTGRPLGLRTTSWDLLFSSSSPLLAIPFARSRILESLGAVTMMCFLDDDLICEPYSVAEEILLLNSADSEGNSGRGTVLDLHANPEATGSRFENPKWWQRLPSLKPVGLNAMLTYIPTAPISRYGGILKRRSTRHGHGRSRSFISALGVLDSSPEARARPVETTTPVTPSSSETTSKEREIALVDHVRKTIPQETLRELAEEIGFTEQDVRCFTRLLEINVIAPALGDIKLLEDTHAWGQEETRRRGTLTPHIRGAVVMDARGGGLQMMSHGDPSLLLSYCREYWDGDSITPLTPEDRKEVLNVYQRWDLEDFDVVAFGYTPVPHVLHDHIVNAHKDQEALASKGDLPVTYSAQSNCLYFVESGIDADSLLKLLKNNEKLVVDLGTRQSVSVPPLHDIGGEGGSMKLDGDRIAAINELNGGREGGGARKRNSQVSVKSRTSLARSELSDLSNPQRDDTKSDPSAATDSNEDLQKNPAAKSNSLGIDSDASDADVPSDEKSPPNFSQPESGNRLRNLFAESVEELLSHDPESSRIKRPPQLHMTHNPVYTRQPVISPAVSASSNRSMYSSESGTSATEVDADGREGVTLGQTMHGLNAAIESDSDDEKGMDKQRAVRTGGKYQGDEATNTTVTKDLSNVQRNLSSMQSRSETAIDAVKDDSEGITSASGPNTTLFSDLSPASKRSVRKSLRQLLLKDSMKKHNSEPILMSSAENRLERIVEDTDPNCISLSSLRAGPSAPKLNDGRPRLQSFDLPPSELKFFNRESTNVDSMRSLGSATYDSASISGSVSEYDVGHPSKIHKQASLDSFSYQLSPSDSTLHKDSSDSFALDRGSTVRFEKKGKSKLEREPMSEERPTSLVTSHSHSSHERSRGHRSLPDLLFPLMRQQVFLGVAASSVPVKPEIPQLVEDLNAAGVRFVYFSPRNMRRSKPIAEKIGLQTDWNCAISLRDLDDDEHEDPHRFISNYADWDVKARLPHGVDAIRKHLREVDNVPLLVSLYTDSQPKSIRQMIEIFRDHGEVVMTVGSCHRAHNYHLFAASDVSVGVALLPGEEMSMPAEIGTAVQRFPKYSSKSLCQSDLIFTFSLIGLHTTPLLQAPCLDLDSTTLNNNMANQSRSNNRDPLSESMGNSDLINHVLSFASDDVQRDTVISVTRELALMSLLEGIRTGRVFLVNALQALGFLSVSVLALAAWPLLAQTIPMAIQPTLPPPMALLFLCFYLPLLLLAMLFTPAHEHIMRTCPKKNILVRRWRDELRFIQLLACRAGCIAFSVLVLGWICCASLVEKNAPSSYRSDRRFFYMAEVLGDHSMVREMTISEFWLVQDIMSSQMLLATITQMHTMLHRGQAFLQGPERWPTYYPVYFLAITVCIVVHAIVMLLRAIGREDGWGDYQEVDSVVWVAMALLPVAGIPVGYMCNAIDDRWYKRHLQFLRLEFDTRLGMHSPR